MKKVKKEETTELEQYHIHHSTGESRFSEKENQPREYAGFVHATSLEQAYQLSQNRDSPWNTIQPCRSTSVGDVIQDDKGFHMVCNFGFTTLLYT